MCFILWPLLLYGHWLSAQWQMQPLLRCSSISPYCHLNTEDLDMESSDLRTPPTQTSPQHLCYLFLGCLTLCNCHIVQCLHPGYPDITDQLYDYVHIFLLTSVCFFVIHPPQTKFQDFSRDIKPHTRLYFVNTPLACFSLHSCSYGPCFQTSILYFSGSIWHCYKRVNNLPVYPGPLQLLD